MAYAWFICPYQPRTDPEGLGRIMRECAMNNFNAAIQADGGRWSESEALGNVAVVKVSASATTLTTIAGTTGFIRIPNHFNLNDTLSDLTSGQRTTILNKLTSMGYTTQEISAALGSNLTAWRTKTLRQLLNFAASRRRKVRWDGSQLVFDGATVTPKPITIVDAEVA